VPSQKTFLSFPPEQLRDYFYSKALVSWLCMLYFFLAASSPFSCLNKHFRLIGFSLLQGPFPFAKYLSEDFLT